MELPHLGLMRLYGNEEVFFDKTAGVSLLDKIAAPMVPSVAVKVPTKAPGGPFRTPGAVAPAPAHPAVSKPALVTPEQQQRLLQAPAPQAKANVGRLQPAQAGQVAPKTAPTAAPAAAPPAPAAAPAAASGQPGTLLGSIGIKPWHLALGGLAAGGMWLAGKGMQATGDIAKGVGSALGGGGGHHGPQQWVSPGTPGLRAELSPYGY